MNNVLVEKNKLDVLANAISNKSGEPLTLTLDEMVEAVDGIEQGIQPSGNVDITHAGQTDVTNYATATVPSAEMYEYDYLGIFSTVGGTRRWTVGFEGSYGSGGWIQGIVEADGKRYSAVPQNTTVIPTESAQTIGGANYMMEGAVTVSAIPSNYVGSGITQRSSTDLTVSGATVTAPSGYYSASASKSVASGTAGTPTATKGTVSNHSVSVTPSVTNTTGYITGGTINGTAVSVSASELVNGSETKTQNGTYDVTNLAELVVNVQGGGGSSSWKLLASQEYTKSTTGTSASTVGTIACGAEAWDETKIIYCRIRDKAGKRSGYFYGSDTFFINQRKANGTTTALAEKGTIVTRYTASSQFATYISSSPYGVYSSKISSNGDVTVQMRYNSSYSLTIDGTYLVEVYVLETPDGVSPFA